jgi:hypothetical protein
MITEQRTSAQQTMFPLLCGSGTCGLEQEQVDDHGTEDQRTANDVPALVWQRNMWPGTGTSLP